MRPSTLPIIEAVTKIHKTLMSLKRSSWLLENHLGPHHKYETSSYVQIYEKGT